MIRAKSGIKISQVQKAVDEQSSADEKYERDGDFADYKQTAELISFATHGRIAAAFFQRIVEIGI